MKPTIECRNCGAPVAQPDRGRARVYCNSSCRVQHWRSRNRKLAEDTDRASEREAEQVRLSAASDPAGAVAEWSRRTLKVPPGHPREGDPLVLPAYIEDFLREASASGMKESLLCVARKNAKSAGLAIWALAHLAGPLRKRGWRGAVASLTLAKAAEFRAQVEAIAKASGLEGIKWRRSPYPGAIESAYGELVVLSSDKNVGAASSFDAVFIDEVGLFNERSRDMINGLRTSVSAKDGRIYHLSVRGDSPLLQELLDNPEVHSVIHAGSPGADLFDKANWEAANPGLREGIKSWDYMDSITKRASHSPADELQVRALDLNEKLNPTLEMIVAPAELQACFVEALPDRKGPAVVGLDIGSARSLTGAAVVWPATGRMELHMACGGVPDLQERSKFDGEDYVSMARLGSLTVHQGRTVDVVRFVRDLAQSLNGVRVEAMAADNYKSSEVEDAMDRAGVRWPYHARRVGAGPSGGADVRAFIRLVLERRLKLLPHLGLVAAIARSHVRYDPNGNPGLHKAGARGRIDILSAAIIAAGLSAPRMERAAKGLSFAVV